MERDVFAFGASLRMTGGAVMLSTHMPRWGTGTVDEQAFGYSFSMFHVISSLRFFLRRDVIAVR